MDRRQAALSDRPDAAPETASPVVPLRAGTTQPTAEERAEPPGRLHAIAMAGMAVFAIVGILATLAFITVGWPGDTGRRVIAVVVIAAVGFVASASAAILAAARDTYPKRKAARRARGEPPL